MADTPVISTEKELRGYEKDLREDLEQYDRDLRAIEERRSVLAEKIQGSMAILEKHVSDYEHARDALDANERDLRENRQKAQTNYEVVQEQLKAKQAVKQDPLGRQSSKLDEGQQKASPAQDQPKTMATKQDIEKLKEQLAKPEPSLELKPPGGESQTDLINRDLKLAKEIHQKQGQLNDASQNVNHNFPHNNGPKRT